MIDDTASARRIAKLAESFGFDSPEEFTRAQIQAEAERASCTGEGCTHRHGCAAHPERRPIRTLESFRVPATVPTPTIITEPGTDDALLAEVEAIATRPDPWFDAVAERLDFISTRLHVVDESDPDSCVHWTGNMASNGYGRIRWIDGRVQPIHRVLHQLEHGPIPAGLQVDHTCHNADESCPGGNRCLHRRCVKHTEVVTQAENIRRGRGGANNRRKTHCPSGHSYAEHGTSYECKDGATRRFCNLCPRGERAADRVGLRAS